MTIIQIFEETEETNRWFVDKNRFADQEIRTNTNFKE